MLYSMELRVGSDGPDCGVGAEIRHAHDDDEGLLVGSREGAANKRYAQTRRSINVQGSCTESRTADGSEDNEECRRHVAEVWSERERSLGR
jgi:hypothetical protein